MSVWISLAKLEAAGGQKPCSIHSSSSSTSWVFTKRELISMTDHMKMGLGWRRGKGRVLWRVRGCKDLNRLRRGQGSGNREGGGMETEAMMLF